MGKLRMKTGELSKSVNKPKNKPKKSPKKRRAIKKKQRKERFKIMELTPLVERKKRPKRKPKKRPTVKRKPRVVPKPRVIKPKAVPKPKTAPKPKRAPKKVPKKALKPREDKIDGALKRIARPKRLEAALRYLKSAKEELLKPGTNELKKQYLDGFKRMQLGHIPLKPYYKAYSILLDKIAKNLKAVDVKLKPNKYYLAIALIESALDPRVNADGLMQITRIAREGVNQRFDMKLQPDDIYTDSKKEKEQAKASKNNMLTGILYWHVCRDYHVEKLSKDFSEEDKDRFASFAYNLGPYGMKYLYNALGKPKTFDEFAYALATNAAAVYPDVATAERVVRKDKHYNLRRVHYLKLREDASKAEKDQKIQLGKYKVRISKLLISIRYAMRASAMMHGEPKKLTPLSLPMPATPAIAVLPKEATESKEQAKPKSLAKAAKPKPGFINTPHFVNPGKHEQEIVLSVPQNNAKLHLSFKGIKKYEIKPEVVQNKNKKRHQVRIKIGSSQGIIYIDQKGNLKLSPAKKGLWAVYELKSKRAWKGFAKGGSLNPFGTIFYFKKLPTKKFSLDLLSNKPQKNKTPEKAREKTPQQKKEALKQIFHSNIPTNLPDGWSFGASVEKNRQDIVKVNPNFYNKPPSNLKGWKTLSNTQTTKYYTPLFEGKMTPKLLKRLRLEGGGIHVNNGRATVLNYKNKSLGISRKIMRGPSAYGRDTLTTHRTIAVDTDIIPLGTWVYVDFGKNLHTGWYRAEDTGGAIKGNHIDVFSGVGIENYRHGKKAIPDRAKRIIWKERPPLSAREFSLTPAENYHGKRLKHQVPARNVPIHFTEQQNYNVEGWTDQGYPIITIKHFGRVRITGGFMEPEGHARKGLYRVMRPNGTVRKIGNSHMNLGVDYVLLDSPAVKSWYKGEVVFARLDGGYGYRVIIKTNKTITYKGKKYPLYQAYAHLKKSLKVNIGDKVNPGTQIGTMGGTGKNGKNKYSPHVDLRSFILPKDASIYGHTNKWIEIHPNMLPD